MTRRAKDELFRTISQNLKQGKPFHLGTAKPDYWRAIIHQQISCKIEQVEDGLKISR